MVNCANVINHFIFVFFLYFFLSPLLPRRSVYCFNFEDFTDQVSGGGGGGTRASSKTQKNPVTVKPIDWIEAIEVSYTDGHHGTMQTIV